MASNIFPTGLQTIVKDGLDTMTPTLALMSSDNANATDYVYASTHQYFDTATNDSGDPSYCETGATDYVKKVLVPNTSITVNLDTGSTRLEIVITDQTWTGLGGVTNETITGAVLFDDTGDPLTSPLIAYFDISDTTTTDADFTLDFDANGNIRLPYTIS